MSDARVYEVGPGFVRTKECPDCSHTRCSEECVCNCDAARAEHEASCRKTENEQLRAALKAAQAAAEAADDEAKREYAERLGWENRALGLEEKLRLCSDAAHNLLLDASAEDKPE